MLLEGPDIAGSLGSGVELPKRKPEANELQPIAYDIESVAADIALNGMLAASSGARSAEYKSGDVTEHETNVARATLEGLRALPDDATSDAESAEDRLAG